MNAPDSVPVQQRSVQVRIGNIAPNDGGIQERVDTLAVDLGRPVILDDSNLNAIAYSQHGDDELDPVRLHSILRQRVAPDLLADVARVGVGSRRSAFWVPAMPRWKMAARLCIPVRVGEAELGYLWIADPDRSMSREQVATGEQAANDLALLLDHSTMERDRAEQTTQLLLRRLFDSEGHPVSITADLVAHEGLPSRPSSVVLVADIEDRRTEVQPGSTEAVEIALAIGSRLRGTRAAARWLVFATERMTFVPVAEESTRIDPVAIAEAVRGSMEAYFGSRVTVGASGMPEPLEHGHRSRRRALAALTVAASVDGPGSVRSWSDLSYWKLLARVAGRHEVDDDLAADLHPGVLALFREDRASLLATVEAYFDHAGDASATAAELHLHRSTLYYRLDKISEITGLDLRSGEARFELMLGLRVARIAGMR